MFILSVAMSHDFYNCELLFLTRSGGSRRILNISQLSTKYNKNQCKAILGLHIFTGCDSVSTFKGKGKVKPLSLMLKSDEFINCFATLGTTWDDGGCLLPVIEKFVCTIYGQQDCTHVNIARYNLFCLICHSDEFLPPNQDCLQNHLKRANFQAAVHRRCLLQYINAPSPVGHGWKLEGNHLVFDWMSKNPAPRSVLKTENCKCQKNDCKGACSCSRVGLPCTDLCHCPLEVKHLIMMLKLQSMIQILVLT